MAAHAAYGIVFPARPLDFYLETLEPGGLKVESVRGEHRGRVDDWYELLRTYHDAVLGWVGGTEKIDGAPPSPEAVADRPGVDPPRHGRPVPRTGEVPGLLDVHHLRQLAATTPDRRSLWSVSGILERWLEP